MDYDNIKTHSIDSSTFVANNKVIFRLQPNTVYRSNLKLMNLGFRDSAGNNVGRVNRLTGALGQIKSIKMVDKGVEISKQMFVQPYIGFLNSLGSNKTANNIRDVKHQTAVSRVFQIADSEVAGGAPVGNAGDTGIGMSIGVNHFMDQIAQNENITAELELNRLLPILSNMEYIPTNVFDDCSIQVEFYSSVNAPNGASSDIRVRPSNAELDPVFYLMAEEVLGAEAQDAMDNVSSVSWNEIEHDQFTIPRATQNVEQETKQRVKGFDNKSLGRLVLLKEPETFTYIAGNAINGYGRLNSQAQEQEKVNFVVNGKTLLTSCGVEHPASRMALTVDTFGDYVSYMGSNEEGLSNVANWLGDGANMEGIGDYLGITVSQKVQDLQVEFKRTSASAQGAGKNGSLNIHLYGEVGKSLVVGGGGYTVVYN